MFYFESETSGYTVYMGADKFENEGLIQWGLITDLWFHVEGLSSAHVYLRVPLETAMCGCEVRCGCLLDKIPEPVVEEMCQLVKANSIEGCKKSSVMVVYTPHSNLHKDEQQMKTGAVGFHNSKNRRLRRVDKDKEIVKRLEKTRREAHPDLHAEKVEFEKAVIEYKKKVNKELLATMSENDPRRAEEEQKKQRADFLARGGYHGGHSDVVDDDPLEMRNRHKPTAGDAFSGLSNALKEMSGVAIFKGERKQRAQDDDNDESLIEHLLESEFSWEAEAKVRAQDNEDVRWLRERGVIKAVAEEAITNTGDRLKALASLIVRDTTEVGDHSDADEQRAEEREALTAIYEDVDMSIGGDSVGVPVVGFELEPGAPQLVLEVHIDEIALSYPCGGLPLLAAVGGGLLESELRELTTFLFAHAVQNVGMGLLVFELVTVAGEKATELVERRQRVIENRKKEFRQAAAERNAEKTAEKTAKIEAAKAEAAKNTPVAEKESEAATHSTGKSSRAADAMARLGQFAPVAAAAPVVKTPAEEVGFDEALGAIKMDKGGYKKKKK